MSVFVGSAVAAITPFDKDNKIDLKMHEKFIDFLITNESDAIVSCGTTGEASTLTIEEQKEIIKSAVEVSSKRVPIIAGCGSNNTLHAAKLCELAQLAGADACLVVTPYYNKTTQSGLVEHYKTIASATTLPIILYNVPSRTGLSISPQTCKELSEMKNIVGIKEASGNISTVMEIAELCGNNFDIYSGNDDQILPVLSCGGKGVISVLANIAPKNTHDIVMDYINGNKNKALELQLKAMPLIRALFCEVNPIPVKEALNQLGFSVGCCRLPLVEMDNSNTSSLISALKNYGLL